MASASTPHGNTNNGQHQPETPISQRVRLKGCWKDRNWWCNFIPRKKAAIHETRDGINKGRLYYKCNTHPCCDFFLWHDKAKSREMGLSPETRRPSYTQRPLTAFGYQIHHQPGDEAGEGAGAGAGGVTDSDYDSVDAINTNANTASTITNMAPPQTPCPPSTNRKRDALSDEEYGGWSSDGEEQLAEMADESAKKAAIVAGKQAVAANQTHTLQNGIPTPATNATARQLFPPSQKRQRQTVAFEDSPSTSTAAATATVGSSSLFSSPLNGTPTPVRTQAGGAGNPQDEGPNLTKQITNLLKDQDVGDDVLKSVQDALTMAARKMRGIEMGRDTARAALKMRDDKITRLQGRIAELEEKEKVHYTQMTDFKAGLMKMYEKN